MVVSARGVAFMTLLLLASLLYTTLLLFPSVCLLVVPPPWFVMSRRCYRRWTGFCGYLFFAMAAYLLENLCRIKVGVFVVLVLLQLR